MTKVSPKKGPTSGGTRVVVKGHGFKHATKVLFGSKRGKKLKIKSDVKLVVVSPKHSDGRVNVRVVVGKTKSKVTKRDRFKFVAPAAAAPVVSDVSPGKGPATGGTVVTITGKHLTGATGVSFGPGAPATTYTVVSSTKVTATAPAHAAGAVDVQVATASGTSTVSGGDRFTYVAAPTVTGVSPASGSSPGGTLVTVTGTNLTGATQVLFGDVASTSVTVVSATQLTATAPAHAVGAVDVKVVTVGGTSTTSTADQYTYVAPGAPVIVSLAPSSGPIAGGTVVTITGTDLDTATAVTFDGIPGTITSDSPTQIVVTTPTIPTSENAPVIVTTSRGMSNAGTFTYVS